MINRFWIFDLRFGIYARLVCLIAAALFFAPGVSRAETIVLKNAFVHTVSGETIPGGSVLIQNGKIVQVLSESSSSTLIPNDATEINLSGQHLYPGLIALDTALGLSEISGVRSTRDVVEVGAYTPDVESWVSVNPDSELIPVARANGITHIEPAPQGGIVAGQSGLVALSGWTVEEMAVKKPAALHVYWPSMDLDLRTKDEFPDKAKWKSPDDQAKERKTKLRELDEFFADARAYSKAKSAAEKKHQPEKVPAWEAMFPFIRGEAPVFVHADDKRQIKAVLKWAKSNSLKVVLVGGRDAWLLAKEIAAQKIPVIYEHIYNQPSRDTDRYDVNFRAPKILRDAGVTVAIGMGADTFDAALVKNLPYTAAQAVAFGLSEADALRSLTLVPAQLVGVENRLGSIQPGKEATLIAVNGNIFDIRANVKHVWIAGKEVDLQTRHTRLYEKYKNRPREQKK